MNSILSIIKPVMKETILLRLLVFEERLNNWIIFFPIVNDTNKVDNINPIMKISNPKTAIGKPIIVIAVSAIARTNTIINRNPIKIFFIKELVMAILTMLN